jgi:hypothetical protein
VKSALCTHGEPGPQATTCSQRSLTSPLGGEVPFSAQCANYLSLIISKFARLNVFSSDHDKVTRPHQLVTNVSKHLANTALDSISYNSSLFELCRDSDRQAAMRCWRINNEYEKVLGVKLSAVFLTTVDLILSAKTR